MRRGIVLLSACVGAFALFGDQVAATETPFTYSLHSGGSPVAAVKSSSANPLNLVMRAGDGLAKVSPSGTATVLESGTSAGGYALSADAFDAGGVWTLKRTAQGGVVETATVTVRHSLYGTQGAGTAANPATLVDADELADLVSAGTAGNGYVFMLDGAADGLRSRLSLPAGYFMEPASDGAWRIATSTDGCVAKWSAADYAYNGISTGPGRKVKLHRDVTPPVAYSGDNWHWDVSAGSTLTVESPSGVTTPYELAGTGQETRIAMTEKGVWTLTLVSCGGTKTETATVEVMAGGLLLIVK